MSDYCNSKHLPFFAVSAKTGLNVEKAVNKSLLIKQGLQSPFELPILGNINPPNITLTYFGTENDELLFESCLYSLLNSHI